MAWLWLISVGVTDVQFPVWKQGEYGQWTGPWRFRRDKGGVRALHEGLLALLENDQVVFPEALPDDLRGEEGKLQLQFEQKGNGFIASVTTRNGACAGYRISDQGDTIPNGAETQLPLYCPKVADLLAVAGATFGDEPVTVVVLNTRRLSTLRDGPDEPIASGPLVAQFLAGRLGLDYRDHGGAVPSTLESGTSTWLDILIGAEAMEDSEAQQQVVRRLTGLIRAWTPGGDRKVAITPAGGMPPLKPIIERVPATCLGQTAIRLLESPERGRGSATVNALNYDARVAERETLRFHCTEALRQGDYAGAYGLARRFSGASWAGEVRDLLGPLLELPGGPLKIERRQLEFFALSACQVEIALCLNDAGGALKRFAQFLESSIWALIMGDARIRQLKLKVKRDRECLIGGLAKEHELFKRDMLTTEWTNPKQHRVQKVLARWPDWLKQPAGGQQAIASALYDLKRRYLKEPKVPSGYPGSAPRLRSLRDYRNRLVHGSREPVSLQQVETCLRQVGLIQGLGQDFGRNFLQISQVDELLSGLGVSGLGTTVGKRLETLLNTLIEG